MSNEEAQTNAAGGQSVLTDGLAIIDGKVLPRQVYYPRVLVTTWFKTWGIQCGRCYKDFHRFALFGNPACPYCGTKNAPQFYGFC